MYDYPTLNEWIENEWHYYALIAGIDDNVVWHLTPKTIQVYLKAYNKRRQIAIQDLWLQGRYFACAIASTLQFGKQKPPEYPPMPYEEEVEISQEQIRAYRRARREQLKAFLEHNKKK